jgi:hypothetical protein
LRSQQRSRGQDPKERSTPELRTKTRVEAYQNNSSGIATKQVHEL